MSTCTHTYPMDSLWCVRGSRWSQVETHIKIIHRVIVPGMSAQNEPTGVAVPECSFVPVANVFLHLRHGNSSSYCLICELRNCVPIHPCLFWVSHNCSSWHKFMGHFGERTMPSFAWTRHLCWSALWCQWLLSLRGLCAWTVNWLDNMV
jgi:hypothetical protein